MRDAGPMGMTTRSGRKVYDDMTVGDTARLVGVSVRTLHHWDEIGLVVPSARSVAGYRLYDAEDVTRIHQVLVYRETGMSLADVAEVIDEADAAVHLTRQRELLLGRIDHLQRMVRAVDTMMESTMSSKNLTPQEQAEIWGQTWNPEYQEEAETRWGGTEDWTVSERRKAEMTAEDLTRARDETAALESRLAQALRTGVTPGSEEANVLAEAHRADLSRWFEVTPSKHVLLARGYVSDPRFTSHYEDREPGLAVWLKEVIDANAVAHGVDPVSAQWE